MQDSESVETFVSAVAKQTWEVFRRDALLYVLAACVVMLLSAVSLLILTGPLMVGFIELVRRAGRGEHPQLGDLFDGFRKFGASFVALLLVAIATSLGLLLLLVPGLLVIVFSCFALQAIAYEELGPVDALRRSAALVQAHFLPTLVMLVLLSILQSLGGSIVLGVLLTMPLSLIATSIAYERMAAASPVTGPATLAM